MKRDLSLDEIVRHLAHRNARYPESRTAVPLEDGGLRSSPGIVGWGVPLVAMTGLALGMLGAFGVPVPGL